MREFTLILLGISTGLLMSAWAGWHIIGYLRSDKQKRHQRRFYFRLALFFALIGLADLAKAVQSLLAFLV